MAILTSAVFQSLVVALVLSRLDYCNSGWGQVSL